LGGSHAEVKEQTDICPCLLAGLYKGYSTYGIPGVVEVYKEECTTCNEVQGDGTKL
jgi:hypothetical protein